LRRRSFLGLFTLSLPGIALGQASGEEYFRQFDPEGLVKKVTVQSPMTEADHVKTIRLLSERNPETQMAVFHLGPRAGTAEISSRVRLAGSQRVVALAEMSDGSSWIGTADVVVTLSACVDGTG